jgi:hypothetical protein
MQWTLDAPALERLEIGLRRFSGCDMHNPILRLAAQGFMRVGLIVHRHRWMPVHPALSFSDVPGTDRGR